MMLFRRYGRLVIGCCALACNLPGKAQNLVPNPSFEQIRKQPCKYSRINENISNYLTHWFTPTAGSTDVWFHTEILSPDCSQNTQSLALKPNSGNYCIGLFATYQDRRPPIIPTIYREYASVQLSQPLQAGKAYYVRMYVLLRPDMNVAVNNLGFSFSTDSIYRAESSQFPYIGVLNYRPQVNSNRVLSQTGQWVEVSGCFLADSAYRYLTIGNFFSDQDTRFQNFKPKDLNSSYYLIDDVLVREATTDQLPRGLDRRRDTTLCPNQSWSLALPQNGDRYRWEDGSTSPTRILAQDGTYWLSTTRGECARTDTIRIRTETPIRLPADTLLCIGEALTLKPAYSSRRYQWQDGSRDSTLTVMQTGLYWVSALSKYCRISDSIRVNFADCAVFVPNVITPNGDGKNDFFVVQYNQDIGTVWRLVVYNRWGKLIYETNHYHNNWAADNLPGGLYYYYLADLTTRNKPIKGWLQVLR